MKKIALALAIGCMMFSGCIFNRQPQIDVIDCGDAFSTTNASTSFSNETYVWETWSQSTNTTTNIVK